MIEQNTSIKNIELLGNNTALDFINTIEFRKQGSGEVVNDFLNHHADLAHWGRVANIITKLQSQTIERLKPSDGEQFLSRAKVLRELLYSIFSKLIAGRPVNEDDLNNLTKMLIHFNSLRIISNELKWIWRDGVDAQEIFLGEIVYAAESLLLNIETNRLKMCSGGDCGWLFYDKSKGGQRRWCDMNDCGNRDKAKSYYNRHAS